MTEWILIGWLFLVTPSSGGPPNPAFVPAPRQQNFKNESRCTRIDREMVDHLKGASGRDSFLDILPICVQR